MKKFIVIFRHAGTQVSKIVEAYNRTDAMRMVCSFVYSCEELQSRRCYMPNEIIRCCFCGEVIDGYGNNPEPLKTYPNRCCDKCNSEVVIPERIKRMKENGGW